MSKHFLIVSGEEIILKLYDLNINNAYKVFEYTKEVYKNDYKNIEILIAEEPDKPIKHAIY